MASTGWRAPAANTVEAGSGTWTNDTNIRVDDGAEATFSLTSKNTSGRWNAAQTFGFDSLIPDGATIDSVEIRAEWRCNSAAGIGILELQAFVGGNAVGAVRDNAAEPATLTTDTFDITADRSWTRADLLNANFELKVRGRNGNSTTDPSYRVDHIAVQVGYTEAPLADNPPPRTLAKVMAVATMAWAAANYTVIDHTPSATASQPSAPSGAISGTSSLAFTNSGTLSGGQVEGKTPRAKQQQLASQTSYTVLEFRRAGLTAPGAAPPGPVDNPPIKRRTTNPAVAQWTPTIEVVHIKAKDGTPNGLIYGTSSLTFSNQGTLSGIVAARPVKKRRLEQTVAAWQKPWKAQRAARIAPLLPQGAIGSVSGNAAQSFANTGTLSGKGALSGTAAQAFTNAGVLTGKGSLAGVAAQTFDNSGTLNLPPGALVGTAAQAFTDTATLTGRGVLAGTASQAFTNAGTLNQPPAVLAGSADQAFTNTGVLSGRGTLAGTAVQAFTATGSLAGRGSMAGTSTPSFSLQAVLGGRGALAGVAQQAFSTTGVLVLPTGGMIGSAAQFFTNTGTLTGKGALAGSSGLVFTQVGLLTGRAQLVGTSGLSFSLSGELTPPGPIYGSVSVVFVPTGTLIGRGALAGSADMKFSAIATFVTDRRGRISMRHKPAVTHKMSHKLVTKIDMEDS